MTGANDRTVPALSHDRLRQILQRYGREGFQPRFAHKRMTVVIERTSLRHFRRQAASSLEDSYDRVQQTKAGAGHSHRVVFPGFFTSAGDAAGPQGFGSSPISCMSQNICGSFFVGPPEPLAKGEATTQLGGPGGSIKVKVDGANPSTTYEVRMLSQVLGPPPPGVVVGLLTTDANGDGTGTFPLVLGETYVSGAQLWRDSDSTTTCLEPFCSATDPRIVTAFIVQ